MDLDEHAHVLLGHGLQIRTGLAFVLRQEEGCGEHSIVPVEYDDILECLAVILMERSRNVCSISSTHETRLDIRVICWRLLKDLMG